jgi:hypothetical protein
MTCAWELKWVLGKSYGSLVCLGSEWIKEFTGSANGGRRRVALAREEVRKGSFIALGARRGGCSVASWPTVATTWRGGGWRALVANGGWRFSRRCVRAGRVSPA